MALGGPVFLKLARLQKMPSRAERSRSWNKKIKPSRLLEIGTVLTIRQGLDDKTVNVLVLSEQRRGASEAQMLYAETADSQAQREKNQAERKALNQSIPQTIRPNKKQRRQIHQFLDQ
jgi:ribosome-associated heat shock protein Hsp15